MAKSKPKFVKKPGTKLGWWAVGLMIAFVTMLILNAAVLMRLQVEIPWWQTFLHYYGMLIMFSGVAALVMGLIAIISKHERSWMVWLALFPGAISLFFFLMDMLI